MLSRDEIRYYRLHNNLSLRDVANYCDVSFQLIEKVENGTKEITNYNHDEIIRGINGAVFAKKRGTLKQVDKTTGVDNEIYLAKNEKKDIKRKTPKVDILNEENN